MARINAGDPAPGDDVSVDVLLQYPLFHGIPEAALQRLAARARVTDHEPGASVAQTEELQAEALIVLSGVAGLYRLDTAGRLLLVDRLVPGESSCTLPMPDDEQELMLLALDDGAHVLRLPRGLTEETLSSRIGLKDPVLQELQQRVLRGYARQGELAFEPLKTRLGRALARLARRNPLRRVYETDEQLGALVGARCGSVNRVLQELRKEGLVEFTSPRRWITVPDPDRLERPVERA